MLIKLSGVPFNKHYEGAYDEEMRRWRQIGAMAKAANIVELLSSGAAEIKTVLEVGCGTGAVLSRLAQLGVGEQYKGIDVFDPRTHVPAEDASDPRNGIDTYGDTRIDAPDNSVDFVLPSTCSGRLLTSANPSRNALASRNDSSISRCPASSTLERPRRRCRDHCRLGTSTPTRQNPLR